MKVRRLHMDGSGSDWAKLIPIHQSEGGFEKKERRSSMDLVRMGVRGNGRWSPPLEGGPVGEGAADNQRRESGWHTGEADGIPL